MVFPGTWQADVDKKRAIEIAFRRQQTVHLIEVGYTGDYGLHDRVAHKLTQHGELQAKLLDHSWKEVHMHAFVIGHTGMQPQSNMAVLQALQVDDANSLLATVHAHSVDTCYSLLRSYERELNPGSQNHNPAAKITTPAAKITTPTGQPQQQGKKLVALERRLQYGLHAPTFILDRFMMLYMRSTIFSSHYFCGSCLGTPVAPIPLRTGIVTCNAAMHTIVVCKASLWCVHISSVQLTVKACVALASGSLAVLAALAARCLAACCFLLAALVVFTIWFSDTFWEGFSGMSGL